MKVNVLSETQLLTNWVNSKKDFSYLKKNDLQYVVAIHNLFTGKNPSIKYDMNILIRDELDKISKPFNAAKYFESLNEETAGLMCFGIGGWNDIDYNVYCVDSIAVFSELDSAMTIAKELNERYIYDNYRHKLIKVDH